MNLRFLTASLLAAGPLVLAGAPSAFASSRVPAASAQTGTPEPAVAVDPQAAPAPERYVRAGERGVTLLNLRDSAGQTLIQVPAGGLLAVHRESAGWLGVDIPGGFPVWVYGRYLRPTSVGSVLEVTGNGINMRPLPSRDEGSFQIRSKLVRGDWVTQIGLNEPGKPLAENWVQIISPEGAFGWVQSMETVPLLRDERGADLWAEAEASLQTMMGALRRRSGLEVGIDEAAVVVPATPAERALVGLAERMADEIEKPLPDFDAVRSMLDEVRTLGPDPEGLEELARLSERLDFSEQLYRAKAEMEEIKLERRREAQRLQAQRLQEIKPRDPLYGRFDLRGKLESLRDASGQVTYVLRQGLHTAAQVECRLGRYDLERFVGCDLGLAVATIEDNSVALAPDLVMVNVLRLEVLSAPLELP